MQEMEDTDIGNKQIKKEPTMNKQAVLAVLEFLRRNNLKTTETQLLREINVDDKELLASTGQTATDVNLALAAYKSDESPSLYEEYYSTLKKMVDSSLDVYRGELSSLLYPFFVHLYLELVINGHEVSARNFCQKFLPDQEYFYADDLHQLTAVTKRDHLIGNDLLDTLKSSKFTVRISRDSYNQLKRFLTDKKQTVLLNILQEHLFLDLFDGVPRTRQQLLTSCGGLLGEAQKDANKAKVYYGLLKEPDLTMTLDEDDEDAEEEKPKKRKSKKDQQQTKKSKHDPNAPPASMRIPLPELRDNDKLEKVRAHKESLKCVSISESNPPSACLYTLLNGAHRVTAVSINEDCSLLAAGHSDGPVHVWSLTSDKLRSLKQPSELELIDKDADDVLEQMLDDKSGVDNRLLKGHLGAVYSLSFSPDKTLLLSSSADGTVRLWSLQLWINLVSYKGHNFPVWGVCFSPHGLYFASCGYDRVARVWVTSNHQPVRLLVGHLADVTCVQFHTNSHYIATGSSDRTVRLWEVSSGNCVRIMTGHKGPVGCLAFSPNGRYLASGGRDKTVIIWDLATGESVSQLTGHTDSVLSVQFCREGKVLASGGMDNQVKVWDVSKLREQSSDSDNQQASSDASKCEIGNYMTKSTPVHAVRFTRRNLLLAAGPYLA